MHVIGFLSRWFQNRSVIRHNARERALLKAVGTLLGGGKLSLTHLGRSTPGDAHVKQRIKAIVRLLGNRHLHAERDGIYRALALSLLQNCKRPVLFVDWADFELDRKWLMLKAAVPMGGRGFTIYEKVFPFKRYNSPGAHRELARAGVSASHRGPGMGCSRFLLPRMVSCRRE